MKVQSLRPTLAMCAGVSALALYCTASAAIAAAPPPNGESPNAAVLQLVGDAQKAVKAGKFPLAIIDLKNAIAADPHNAQVRAELGALLLRTGDYYSAEQELRQARRDGGPDRFVLPILLQTMLARKEFKALLDEFPEPTDSSPMAPDILRARALAYLDSGQPSAANDSMDKSLKLRRDVSGILLRARMAQQTKAPALAMQLANEAISMAPDGVDANLLKLALLSESNDQNSALAFADQVVAKFPSNLTAQFARIEVLLRLKEDNKAKSAVDAILAKTPGLPLAIYDRALLLARAGDPKGAWRIAQSLPPEFLASKPEIAVMAAEMATASGRAETGASILASAMSHFPKDRTLRLALAAMRFKQNDTSGAQTAVAPLMQNLDPDTTEALVRLYLSTNKPDLALGLLQKLVQSGKGTDTAILQLSALEARMGHGDQALKDLENAAEQKPGDALLANQVINNLMMRKQFDAALQIADRLGKDPSQQVAALALRGQVLLAQSKRDDALASYAKAIRLDPKSELALYGHAVILEQMQRYDDASRDVRAIIALNPKNAAAYLKLADIAARQNQDAEVRGVLQQAIDQVPQDPAPRLALAQYQVSRKDQAGALNTASAILKIQPNNTEALELLGRVQLTTGRKTDAVATFKRLVALLPHSTTPQVLLSDALFASGDPKGANAALAEAINLDAKSEPVRRAQINLLFSEKNGDAAVASAVAYQKANAGVQADLLLGDALMRAGHHDQALEVYKKSFSATPTSASLMRIAQSAIAGGDTKSAAQSMSSWLQKNPDDGAVRLGYATLLMQEKDNDGAIIQFRELLKSDPNNVPSLNNLAWLTADKDPKAAIALATKAASLQPNWADVLDTLGWLTLKHGKAADSLPLLKRAHDLSPTDGEISYHLALSLDATGSHDAAKGFLKALLASHVSFSDIAEANKLAVTWQ